MSRGTRVSLRKTRARRSARARASVGRIGERVAADFLVRRGATVVGRNVRVGRDELDLVVEIGGHRVAVEVKTGRGPGTRPAEQFDAAKEARVRRAARSIYPRATRIDLIVVVLESDGVAVRWLPGVG